MSDASFIPGVTRIPASGQIIYPEDKEILHKVVDSGWYTEGKYCRMFKEELKAVTAKKKCVLVNSGSSASLIAVRSMVERSIKKYVVTCATGFPTTVAPIYQSHKMPIYIDIDRETLSPDLNQLEYVLDKHGKNISGGIFAHTLGFTFDEKIVKQMLWKDHYLISDCCDALSSVLIDKMPVGYYSDAMTLSFFPAHHITSGEGGAVLTNSEGLFEAMESYSSWGRSCSCSPGQDNICGKRFSQDDNDLPKGWDHKYTFIRQGYNLHMTEFQAALGYSQIQKLGWFAEQRKGNYFSLFVRLHKLVSSGFISLFSNYESLASPFGFPIIERTDRARELIAWLEDHKISTRRLFGGNLTRQPAFKYRPYLAGGDFTGSDYLMENCFWIGCHPNITEPMIEYMTDTIIEFYKDK